MKKMVFVLLVLMSFSVFAQNCPEGCENSNLDFSLNPNISVTFGIFDLPEEFENDFTALPGINLDLPLEMLRDKISLNISFGAISNQFLFDDREATEEELTVNGLSICGTENTYLCQVNDGKVYSQYNNGYNAPKEYYLADDNTIHRRIYDREKIRVATIAIMYNLNEWLSAGITYSELKNNFEQKYSHFGYKIRFTIPTKSIFTSSFEIGSVNSLTPNYINAGFTVKLGTKKKKQPTTRF